MSKYLRPICLSAVSYLSRVKSGDQNHAVTTEKEHGDTISAAAHTHPPPRWVMLTVVLSLSGKCYHLVRALMEPASFIVVQSLPLSPFSCPCPSPLPPVAGFDQTLGCDERASGGGRSDSALWRSLCTTFCSIPILVSSLRRQRLGRAGGVNEQIIGVHPK